MPDLEALALGGVRFRPVSLDDADYIQALRTEPDYGRHLSPPAPSVDAQREWLSAYKRREAEGAEFYFIITRADDGRRCGTMRVYSIESPHATWGSFILDTAKPPKAAYDALRLVHRFIFDDLDLSTAFFDVRKENTRALALYRRFGGIEISEDDLNLYFRIDRPEVQRRR